MASINDLDISGMEPVPEVDWSAPESGAFPPALTVGVHEFAFALADDPFNTQEIQGKKYLQVTYSATATLEDGSERTLNFQRASTFQNDAMKKAGLNHMMGELLRALGTRIEGPLTPATIADALQQATAERKHFKGEVAWRKYCKACDQTISTAPRKKKGDIAWPKGADGSYELVVACPKCGEKGYGNAEIIRFRLPERGVSTVASSTDAGTVRV